MLFGENEDGSPKVENLWAGSVRDASWDIVGLFIPGRISAKAILAGATALWAKHQAKQAAVATVDDILKGAIKGKVSKSIQYLKTGGFRQAEKDFQALTKNAAVTSRPGGLKTAQLADGTKINVRPFSSGRKPTLEIQPPSGKTIKVRYD